MQYGLCSVVLARCDYVPGAGRTIQHEEQWLGDNLSGKRTERGSIGRKGVLHVQCEVQLKSQARCSRYVPGMMLNICAAAAGCMQLHLSRHPRG